MSDPTHSIQPNSTLSHIPPHTINIATKKIPKALSHVEKKIDSVGFSIFENYHEAAMASLPSEHEVSYVASSQSKQRSSQNNRDIVEKKAFSHTQHLSNNDGSSKTQNTYLLPIDSLSEITIDDMFSNLQDAMEYCYNKIESNCSGQQTVEKKHVQQIFATTIYEHVFEHVLDFGQIGIIHITHLDPNGKRNFQLETNKYEVKTADIIHHIRQESQKRYENGIISKEVHTIISNFLHVDTIFVLEHGYFSRLVDSLFTIFLKKHEHTFSFRIKSEQNKKPADTLSSNTPSSRIQLQKNIRSDKEDIQRAMKERNYILSTSKTRKEQARKEKINKEIEYQREKQDASFHNEMKKIERIKEKEFLLIQKETLQKETIRQQIQFFSRKRILVSAVKKHCP